MYHFNEGILNLNGDALVGHFVQVLDPALGAVVPIYADEVSTPIITVSGKPDKAKVNSHGMVDFYVSPTAGDGYTLTIFGPDSVTVKETIRDVKMNSYEGPPGPPGPAGPAGNILADGNYGDISAASSVLSVNDKAITLAKQADMASASVIYRKTGGVGSPEVQALATLKTDLGLTGTNSGDQTITLTGDVTGTGTGSFVTTLATINGNVGSFGSPTLIPVLTVDAKGRITAASAVASASASFSSAPEVRAGTVSDKAIAPDQLHAAHAIITLTDGATVNWDMATGFNARVTLGGNRTLATPTNPKEGLTYVLEVIQDGTGSRTVTWPASFNWGAAGAPTLSTAANKVDIITLYCRDAATPKFRAVFNKDA